MRYVACALLLALLAARTAHSVEIDAFTDSQGAVGVGGTLLDAVVGPGVLGGRRAVVYSGANVFTYDANDATGFGAPGEFLYTGSALAVLLEYAGPGGAGLGGVDLTDAGASDRLRLGITLSDRSESVFITVVSAGETADTTIAIPATASPLDIDVEFSSFDGTADFASVDRILLSFQPPTNESEVRINTLETRGPASVPALGSAGSAILAMAVATISRPRRRSTPASV